MDGLEKYVPEPVEYNPKADFLEWIADEDFDSFTTTSKVVIVIVQDYLNEHESEITFANIKEHKNKIAEALVTLLKVAITNVEMIWDEENRQINGVITITNEKQVQFVLVKNKESETQS